MSRIKAQDCSLCRLAKNKSFPCPHPWHLAFAEWPDAARADLNRFAPHGWDGLR